MKEKKICFCLKSLVWITKNIKASALPKWRKMIHQTPAILMRKGKSKRRKGKKLRPGIHHVSIHGRKRKVRVLRNGQWRFMKGK